MKRQMLFQNAMIAFSISILAIGFLPGTVTVIHQNAESLMTIWHTLWAELPDVAMCGGFLGLLVLVISVSAIIFRITGHKKALDRMLVASVIAIVSYWLPQFCYLDVSIRFHIAIFILLVCELFFVIIYKVGQRLSIFA